MNYFCVFTNVVFKANSDKIKSYLAEFKSRCAEKKLFSAFNKSTIFLVSESYPYLVAFIANSDEVNA